jgi:hypothetical protein
MVNMISGDRGESPWVIVGTVAGVVGAVAAAAVFILPSADSRSGDSPAGPPSTSSTASASSSSAGGSPSASGSSSTTGPTTELGTAADGRALTALTAESGAGLIRVTGQDIAVGCPSNQSDDTEREFGYALPSAFATLSTRVTLSGTADPDTTASVQVFIKRRQDRSDRIPEVGRVVVTAAAAGKLDAPLTTAVALRFRIRCASPDQTVHLIAPRITR